MCVQCVYELAQNGANLDATNGSGETALHVMIRSNKFECVLALLAKAASAAVRGVNGDSALHMAIEVVYSISLAIKETLHSKLALGFFSWPKSIYYFDLSLKSFTLVKLELRVQGTHFYGDTGEFDGRRGINLGIWSQWLSWN